MQGKTSASARAFCVVLGVVLLAAGGLGGYVFWINKAEADLIRQPATPVSVGELARHAQPAFVRLTGAVPGEPVLEPLSKPPTGDPKVDGKTLPPRMNVWIPLYASAEDRQAQKVSAIYSMRGVPLAAQATLPVHWDGLYAVGAFGMLKATPPAGLPAGCPVVQQPFDNLNVAYWLPGIIGAFVALLGLASFASIPWASWQLPKIEVRQPKISWPERPPRTLPVDDEPLAEHVQTTGGFYGASLYFMVPGLLLVILGGAFIGGMWQAGTLGQSGVVLLFFPVVGFGLIVVGIVRANQRSEQVNLHEAGLSWQEGKTTRSVIWDDIEEVYRTDERTTYQYVFTVREAEMRLVLSDRTELKFDHSLHGYEELSLAVLAKLTPILSDRRQDELAAGSATFGALALTLDGVLHDHKSLQRWEDLAGYTLENGRLWFRTGRFNPLARTYEVKQLANLPVLLEILDEHFSNGASKS